MLLTFVFLKFLTASSCSYVDTSTSTVYLRSGCAFVESNTYSNIHSNSNGGAFSISGSIDVFILDTTFDSCTALNGGAVYMVSYPLSILTYNRVCGVGCLATINSNFDYVQFSPNSEFENSKTLTTITHCSDDVSSGESTSRMLHGTVQINQLNMSYNSAISQACISIGGDIQNLVKFSAFANNTAGQSNFIRTTNSRPEMTNINFINNNQTRDTDALIFVSSSRPGFITDSIFI